MHIATQSPSVPLKFQDKASKLQLAKESFSISLKIRLDPLITWMSVNLYDFQTLGSSTFTLLVSTFEPLLSLSLWFPVTSSPASLLCLCQHGQEVWDPLNLPTVILLLFPDALLWEAYTPALIWDRVLTSHCYHLLNIYHVLNILLMLPYKGP